MIRRTLVILAGAVLLSAPLTAQQDVRLVFAGKPRLLDCRDQPCFRMDVIAVNEQGQAVDLPQGAEFEVLVGDQALPKVSVERRRATTAGGATATRVRAEPRVQLVLFDTSGSMRNKLPGGATRFEAARRQLERLLDGFRDGTDRMAIAAFDSQRVAARIRSATFATSRDEVRRQIEALQPSANGNTALYSAVRESLLVLEPFTKTDAQVSLIAFTDGKNDVGHPIDDKGLLGGDEGLRTAINEARRVGVNIYAIGFGTPGVSFDETAMQALSYPNDRNYFQAGDEGRLTEVFSNISRRAATGARLLAGPLPDSRAALRGQSLQFTVRTGTLSATATWEGNPLMAPPVEGTLTAAESKAVSEWFAKDGPPPAMFPPVVMRVAVLIGYSALLALLWFGMPRLIWPDRYIPKPALPPSRPGARPAGRAPAGGAAPRGARPEVTIPPRPAARPGSAAPPPPARARETPGGPPGRAGRDAAPPPRPAEGLGPRQPTDATVFVPPAKKPGRES